MASGKHAGDRFLVTLDKEISEKLSEIAKLEGLGLATKARQVLTMYVNGITHVPVQAAQQGSVKKSESTSILDDDSWLDN